MRRRKFNPGWSEVGPSRQAYNRATKRFEKAKQKAVDKYERARAKIAEPAPERTKLYFAYGSNLNKRQMRRRCPNARPVGSYAIRDGAMVFRYYADIEVRKGSTLVGGLWRITPECERALDSYEGAGRVYEKRYLMLPINGKKERVLTYKMLPNAEGKLGVGPPDESYYASIERGYKDFGLDLELLQASLYHANNEKEKTEEVLKRWRAKGKPKLAKLAPAAEQVTLH